MNCLTGVELDAKSVLLRTTNKYPNPSILFFADASPKLFPCRKGSATTHVPVEESPYKKALHFQKLLPSQRKKLFSPAAQIVYPRICSLLPDIIDQLEEANAPYHVYRWVVFGKTLPDRVVRLALALHFRRPVNPKKPGPSATDHNWLKDAKQGMAEKLFYESVPGSTLREWISKNLFRMRSDKGSMDPDFWREVKERVESIDRLSFLAQVEQRVMLKPKRKVRFQNGERRRTIRSLTPKLRKKITEILSELVEEDASDDGNKEA